MENESIISEEIENLNINNNLNYNYLITTDHRKIIKESFNFYLSEKNMIFNQINRDSVAEWNLSKSLETHRGIDLFHSDNLQSVKFLGEVLNSPDLKQGKLIKLSCMIQNVFENQLYTALGFNKITGELILNKYFEYEENNNNSDNMNLDEDLNIDDNMQDLVLMERLVLNCIPQPGLNSVLSENLSLTNLTINNKKKIIIYDYENTSHKVNEEIFVIGVAYERENEIVIHSWKMKIGFVCSSLYYGESLYNNKISHLDFKHSKDIIFDFFKNLFGNDELIAEYLILLLVSQVYSRVGTLLIGKLSINLINFNENCDYSTPLKKFLKLITNFFITYQVTLLGLNKDLLFPRFDVNTEELNKGYLQTAKHTLIFLDETKLKEGKLDNLGCKNFNTIKNLIDFQCINYEYPYSNIEIQHDSQILILSFKNKSLFNSASLFEIPISSNQDRISRYTDDFFNAVSGDVIKDLLLWYNLTIYSDAFVKDFKISSEVSEKIQKDFVENSYKSKFSGEDFDNCLKLSRLYAISNGRSELILEDYFFVKELEKKRKERLNNDYKIK